MTRDKTFGHAMAFTANVIFGLSVPVTQLLLLHWMTPVGYTFTRVLFATVVFWIAGLFFKREHVKPRDLLLMAAGGFFGFILSQLLFAIAIQHTTPVHYSLITAMSPIIVMLLAALFLKEPISRMKVVGVALGISGALLLISQDLSGGGGSNLYGILLAVVSNTAYAVYLIITRSVSQRYAPLTMMKWLFLFTTLIVLPFGIPEMGRQPIYSGSADAAAIAMLAFVLLGSTCLTYFLVPFALKYLRATTVSIYMNLQPIVASIAAISIGQDTFTWDKPVALVLVIAGAMVVTHSPAKEDNTPSE